jgi:Bardet-Biedl syndrome 2 protein
MVSAYSSAYEFNRQMMGEYTKRANQQQSLVKALKELNMLINQSSELRIGPGKTEVVSNCKNAIKANQLKQLSAAVALNMTSS